MITTEQRGRDVPLGRTMRQALPPAANQGCRRQEMTMARQFHESLLPALALPPGLTAAAYFRPAQAVGGDLYNLLELPDGRLLAAIADVCGQGVPAARVAVVVQQGIRHFAQSDPAAVLAGVNQLLLEQAPEDMFVTAACVVIDPRDGSAAAAVAGHPPPLYWEHARGRLAAVRHHGPALGFGPDWRGPTARWRLAPGDTLILYTDGVWDVRLNRKERLGELRLTELLSRTAPASPSEWIERLERALDGCLERPDDITAVAIRRETCRFRHQGSSRGCSRKGAHPNRQQN